LDEYGTRDYSEEGQRALQCLRRSVRAVRDEMVGEERERERERDVLWVLAAVQLPVLLRLMIQTAALQADRASENRSKVAFNSDNRLCWFRFSLVRAVTAVKGAALTCLLISRIPPHHEPALSIYVFP
jgi:hypothetical protein